MIKVGFNCYSCRAIGLIVLVPARESPNVDVKSWTEKVLAAYVSAAHRRISPTCPCRTFDLCLPLVDQSDPDTWVGKQTDSSPTLKIMLDMEATHFGRRTNLS